MGYKIQMDIDVLLTYWVNFLLTTFILTTRIRGQYMAQNASLKAQFPLCESKLCLYMLGDASPNFLFVTWWWMLVQVYHVYQTEDWYR